MQNKIFLKVVQNTSYTRVLARKAKIQRDSQPWPRILPKVVKLGCTALVSGDCRKPVFL